MRSVDMVKDGVECVLDKPKCMEEGAMAITGLIIDKWPYKVIFVLPFDATIFLNLIM